MTQNTDWRLVWLLWAAGLGAAAQYGKISVIFERLPEVYPDAGAALGFAVSLVGALGIALGVVAGVLVARIGYRRALLAALVVGGLISLAQSLWPPLWLFLALRVVEGATHLALVVAAPTLIAEVTAPRDQGRALTLWGSFFGVAFAVLAWAGVALAEALGLGALMAAHGLYLLAMAGVLWRQVPTLVKEVQPIQVAEIARAHLRIYRSPRIGAPAIGWLFYTFCFVSTLTVLPPFIDPAWRAITLTAMPLLSIVVSLTLGVVLLRYITAVQVVVVGFFACALSALALWLVPGAPWAALCLGGALGLVQGATFASVPQLNDPVEDRALANGGLAQMGNLGNTSGTPVMLAVIAAFGYTGLVLGMVAVFLFGAIAHIALSLRR
ncbi:MAG: MFS transporter [Pseudomonadota bacterium]